MSDTLASLRRKLKGAEELQSVVRTMKALAASNFAQYENSVQALAAYYRTLEMGLGLCLRGREPSGQFVERKERVPTANVRAIVFGSDQGLAGRFNELVVDHAVEALATLPGKPKVWAVGERVHARLSDAGVKPVGLFAVPNSVRGIAPLVGEILLQTELHRGEDDSGELHLFYNSPQSGTNYAPVSRQLLPLDRKWCRQLAEKSWPTASLPEIINDGPQTLGALIREFLFVSIFRACAESLATENASRLTAMQIAEKNIKELLESLNGSFRQLRQSGIDDELFDVISGFEVLKARDREKLSHRPA